MITLKWTQHAKEDTEISFMDRNNKELIGIIDEVNMSIDKYQKRIYYVVSVNNKSYNVDGECFREIVHK